MQWTKYLKGHGESTPVSHNRTSAAASPAWPEVLCSVSGAVVSPAPKSSWKLACTRAARGSSMLDLSLLAHKACTNLSRNLLESSCCPLLRTLKRDVILYFNADYGAKAIYEHKPGPVARDGAAPMLTA